MTTRSHLYAADSYLTAINKKNLIFICFAARIGFRDKKSVDSELLHCLTLKTLLSIKFNFDCSVFDQWGFKRKTSQIRTPDIKLPLRHNRKTQFSLFPDRPMRFLHAKTLHSNSPWSITSVQRLSRKQRVLLISD